MGSAVSGRAGLTALSAALGLQEHSWALLPPDVRVNTIPSATWLQGSRKPGRPLSPPSSSSPALDSLPNLAGNHTPEKATFLGPSKVPWIPLPSPHTGFGSAWGIADLTAVTSATHCTIWESLFFLLSEEGGSSNSRLNPAEMPGRKGFLLRDLGPPIPSTCGLCTPKQWAPGPWWGEAPSQAGSALLLVGPRVAVHQANG